MSQTCSWALGSQPTVAKTFPRSGSGGSSVAAAKATGATRRGKEEGVSGVTNVHGMIQNRTPNSGTIPLPFHQTPSITNEMNNERMFLP